MSFLLISVLLWTAVLAVLHTGSCLEQPPNIAPVQYGYNLLLGKTPNQQRSELIGNKIFTLTGSISGGVGKYIQYSQIPDMSNSEHCSWTGVSKKVAYAQSSATLSSQSTSSSDGFDQQTSIGVSVPVGPASVSAETTVRNALIFGNSRTSIKQSSERTRGYAYTFDATASRNLYSVEVGYNTFSATDYTANFRQACTSLGSALHTADIVGFFQDYGTHGLRTASFGQKCTSSVFMEGGSSASSYSSFNKDVSNNEVSMLWWTSSRSSEQSDSRASLASYGFEYQYANKHCVGSMKTDSACGSSMRGNGAHDAPAIVKWTYIPIWEMNVAELSLSARSKMHEVFEEFMKAAVQCHALHCNSRGACAPRLVPWSSKGLARAHWNAKSYFFDGNRCFCEDIRVGRNCQTGRQVKVEGTATFPSDYHNGFDGTYTVAGKRAGNYAPFCGMHSYHSNDHEDRRFQWAVCGIEEYPFNLATKWTSLGWTAYDGHWKKECPSDALLAWVKSVRNNDRKDRTFLFQCAHFHNTEQDSCVWDGSWQNGFDAQLRYTCPRGYAMAGIESYHSNNQEDRRFKFKCCSVKAKLSAV